MMPLLWFVKVIMCTANWWATAPHPFLIPTCTCLTRGMIPPVGQSWSWWHQYYWSNRSARWSLARRSCQLCIFVFRVEAELVLLGLKRDTIAHLRPQTVVGENSRSRGEGVSDHLLIWSDNHTFKVISKPYTGSLAYLILSVPYQKKTVALWAGRDFTLGITLAASRSHSLPIFHSAKAVALPVLLFLGKFSVLLLFPHWSLAYVAEDYLQLGFTRLHRPAGCHSARSTELYYNV